MEVLGCDFWRIGNQNPWVDNHNGSIVHAPALSRMGQVAMDGSNGQLLFQWWLKGVVTLFGYVSVACGEIRCIGGNHKHNYVTLHRL